MNRQKLQVILRWIAFGGILLFVWLLVALIWVDHDKNYIVLQLIGTDILITLLSIFLNWVFCEDH